MREPTEWIRAAQDLRWEVTYGPELVLLALNLAIDKLDAQELREVTQGVKDGRVTLLKLREGLKDAHK